MTGAISQDRESCQFLFCLTKIPPLYRSARPESGWEGRERLFMELLARTQSEQLRRLALAGWFSAVGLSGIDRLDAPGSAATREEGWVGPQQDADSAIKIAKSLLFLSLRHAFLTVKTSL